MYMAVVFVWKGGVFCPKINKEARYIYLYLVQLSSCICRNWYRRMGRIGPILKIKCEYCKKYSEHRDSDKAKAGAVFSSFYLVYWRDK